MYTTQIMATCKLKKDLACNICVICWQYGSLQVDTKQGWLGMPNANLIYSFPHKLTFQYMENVNSPAATNTNDVYATSN